MPIKPLTLSKLAANKSSVVGLNLTLEVDSDDDVVKLVNALQGNTLQGNTYLASLTIQGRGNSPGITDKSAELLAKCKNLVFLDISYNKNITNIGAAALAKNKSIKRLFMRGCSVTPSGLYPFLENNTVTDLRIATSASPTEQNLHVLTRDQLNEVLCRFIHDHKDCIEKLPADLQIMAKKAPEEWEEPALMGLMLSRNIAKLKDPKMARVAKGAEIFAQCYGILREREQRLMQFPAVPAVEQRKKQKTAVAEVVEYREPPGSPSI